MPEPDQVRPEPAARDPEALARALELELIAKRAGWERNRARRGLWLALSLLFLLLVVLGALGAYFYFAQEISPRRPVAPRSETTAPDR